MGGIPVLPTASGPMGVPSGSGGVNSNPGGRTGTGGGGGLPVGGAHGGSMESLNSTNSSTLSHLSYGSSISTGKYVMVEETYML